MMTRKSRPSHAAHHPSVSRQKEHQQAHPCELDVSTGLEPVALDEVRAVLGRAAIQQNTSPGVVTFTCLGSLQPVLKLQTVQAAYLVQTFAVARPKALLGDEHFRKLIAQVDTVRGLFPPGAFKTLHLNAAGSDSSVMLRLKNELAARTGLSVALDEGDLLVRIRPAPTTTPADGWQTLMRLSPRPLATRPWRVCNFEGALNAAVAQAMIRLIHPAPRDTFLNLACGSGTLMVERISYGKAARMIGIDVDPQALACAQANLHAAGFGSQAQLLQADARALPLADACASALVADLPFGHLVGSHAQNVSTYPQILREAARVARPGARFGLITHEVRLMEQLLAEPNCPWHAQQVLRVELGGLYPRIFVLVREGER